MKLQEKKIREKISADAIIHLYEDIDSTNNEAKRRIETDRGVHLYAATHQTAGRGRQGHDFYSPKDTGLYMTLSLPLADRPESVQKITCAAAVAVCDAVKSLSGRQPQIKWVNDIFLDGKKAAGILTELVTDSENRPRTVIVGVGMNLCTEKFPEEFAAQAGNLGDIEINALCGAVADNLIALYAGLDDNSVIEKYKQLNLCIGQNVRFVKDGTAHIAKAVDIDPDGGLVVEEKGECTVLSSGEISVLPL